jgi:hypothetical protein
MPGLIATLATVNAYLRARLIGPDSERGSVTIEHVMWAVGVIAIAGIVILAITNYVTGQAEQIR